MANSPEHNSISAHLWQYLQAASRRWNYYVIGAIPLCLVVGLAGAVMIGGSWLAANPWRIVALAIPLSLVLSVVLIYLRQRQEIELWQNPLVSQPRDMITQLSGAATSNTTPEGLLTLFAEKIQQLLNPQYIEIAHHHNDIDNFHIIQNHTYVSKSDPLAIWFTQKDVGTILKLSSEILPAEGQAALTAMMARGVTHFVSLGRLGWVGLGYSAAVESYPDLAFNVLQQMARLVAFGLERLEILNMQKKRTRELEAIYWMAQAVNFSMPLDDIMELIYTQLNRVINMPNFFIALRKPDQERLSFAFLVEGDDRLYPETEWEVAEGLSGHIFQNSITVRTNDYAEECKARAVEPRLVLPDKPMDKAWMGTPLSAGDKTIGVMVASAADPDVRFTAEDENFFVTVAAYTASILERHTLYERLETRARQLSTLNEIGNLLASSLDLAEVLDLVVRNAARLLNSEAGSLLLLDEGSGDLVFRVSTGAAGQKLIGQHVPSGKGIAGAAFSESRPVIVNKIEDDRRWYDGFDKRAKFSTRSIIAVPLNARGRTIGVLEVLNRNDGHPFDNEDSELLLAFGAQAAIAIENAQLFTMTDKALQTRLEELTTLQQIDRQLNATLDYREVMAQTLEWAARITNTSVGVVAALHEEEEGPSGLRFLAHKGYPEETFERYAESELWPLSEGLIGHTVQTGEINLSKDVTQDTHYKAIISGMRSELAVPIEREGRVIGVIALESEKADSFSADTIELISRLADHAAIAIENARLFQQVQRANEAKTEFVSFVSHELKQPMTAMKGYTDLLMKGIGGALNDQQKQFLQVIRTNVGRMDRLVSDLLDVSRIESGRLRLEMHEVMPAEIVSEAVQAFEQAINSKNQTLAVNIEPDLPLVIADRGRLLQVLTNLVSNANKYTPEGGAVTVGLGRLTGENGQLYVRWSVQDTGIGMTPEDLERLFTKYFRASNPAVRSVQGTGLGLVITRSIVELHGGQITVESEYQKGSTFSFTIPVRQTVSS